MSKETIPPIVQPINDERDLLKRALPTPLTVIQATIMSCRRNNDVSDNEFAGLLEMTFRTIMQTNDVRIVVPRENTESRLLFEYYKRSSD